MTYNPYTQGSPNNEWGLPPQEEKPKKSTLWKKILAWTGIVLAVFSFISLLVGSGISALFFGIAVGLPAVWWVLHERREKNQPPMKRHWAIINSVAIGSLILAGIFAPDQDTSTSPTDKPSPQKASNTTSSTSSITSSSHTTSMSASTSESSSEPPTTTDQTTEPSLHTAVEPPTEEAVPHNPAPHESEQEPAEPQPEPVPVAEPAPTQEAVHPAPPAEPEPQPAPIAEPAPQPEPVYEPPAPEPVIEPAPSAYYANCKAARAAGVAPIYRGQPGYRSGLDRDGDGIACDVEG